MPLMPSSALPTFVCNTSIGKRCGYPYRSGSAGPCRYTYHPDLYACPESRRHGGQKPVEFRSTRKKMISLLSNGDIDTGRFENKSIKGVITNGGSTNGGQISNSNIILAYLVQIVVQLGSQSCSERQNVHQFPT